VAGAPPQVGDSGPGGRVGQHPQPERQRGWRNVEPFLDGERGSDRGQVFLVELPVRVAPPVGPVAQRRQQPEILPVAEHPGGHTQPRGSLSDPHEYQSNILLSKIPASACAGPGRASSVDYGRNVSVKKE
jgi:hypothetical protein